MSDIAVAALLAGTLDSSAVFLGEPTSQPKHVTSDLAHRPVLRLDQVILDPRLVEALCPPVRAGEVVVRRSRLTQADPLLQRRQRGMQPHDGDCRTRYRLRDQLQLRTLLDQIGQEQPRRANCGEARPQCLQVPVSECLARPLDRLRPAPREFFELDGGMAKAGFDQQRVSLLEYDGLPDSNGPGQKQDWNHVEEAFHMI
jgi:hypothetical protein